MQTWEAITSRRDVREYTDKHIPRDHLEQIIDAGRRSPSSQNRQPWDFVIVTERDRLRELSEVWQGAAHVAGSAATIALIGPVATDEAHRDRVQYDLGQATMSIMLAATDLGIGAAHAGVSDQALARRLLALPEDRFCAYLVVLGYPAGRALRPLHKPNRRPLESVAHWQRW